MATASIRRLSSEQAAARAQRLVEDFLASDGHAPVAPFELSAAPSVEKTERRGKTPRFWSVQVRVAGMDGGPIYLVDIEAGDVQSQLVGL